MWNITKLYIYIYHYIFTHVCIYIYATHFFTILYITLLYCAGKSLTAHICPVFRFQLQKLLVKNPIIELPNLLVWYRRVWTLAWWKSLPIWRLCHCNVEREFWKLFSSDFPKISRQYSVCIHWHSMIVEGSSREPVALFAEYAACHSTPPRRLQRDCWGPCGCSST